MKAGSHAAARVTAPAQGDARWGWARDSHWVDSHRADWGNRARSCDGERLVDLACPGWRTYGEGERVRSWRGVDVARCRAVSLRAVAKVPGVGQVAATAARQIERARGVQRDWLASQRRPNIGERHEGVIVHHHVT